MPAAELLLIPNSPGFEMLSSGAQFRDRIGILATASRDDLFRAIHEVSLADMKLAWLLGELRYLPSRLAGHLRPADPHRPFLDILRDGGTLVLRDAPYEVMTGSAGQLHRILDQAPVTFEDAAAFAAFHDPGHEKLFMSLRVVPSIDPRSYWLVLDHATLALSPEAQARFRQYWRVIKPAGALVSRELLEAIRRKAEVRSEMELAWS